MLRIPVLSGSCIPLLTIDDDAVLLAPPPPLEPLRDVAAAVVESLRYPLSGSPLEASITRGGRATIVVEPPQLPLPRVTVDPRQEAVAAVIAELDRLGMPAQRQTILVAGGLGRRAGRPELEQVLPPIPARDFRGSAVVHDASSSDLVPLGLSGARDALVHDALANADLIVCVTAAETSERGGANVLLGACAAETIASAPPSASLLAPSLSPIGVLAGAIAAALAARTPVIGVSIVLDHPRLVGRYRGYPSSPEVVAALGRSPMRHLVNTIPSGPRAHLLRQLGRQLEASAVLAGPPAVAHAEALLRGVSLRGAHLEGQLDTIVVPLPWMSIDAPREQLNPITAAATGLGHALRLWRDASPLREGGTVILVHDLRRAFRHGPGAAYRDLFLLLRDGVASEDLTEARRRAMTETRALAAYRKGHAPHPGLPYLEWASCSPVLERAGTVLVAGCRDAGAARALGLVPAHSLPTAVDMARGVAGGQHRAGVLLAPPYVPLIVSEAQPSPR